MLLRKVKDNFTEYAIASLLPIGFGLGGLDLYLDHRFQRENEALQSEAIASRSDSWNKYYGLDDDKDGLIDRIEIRTYEPAPGYGGLIRGRQTLTLQDVRFHFEFKRLLSKD